MSSKTRCKECIYSDKEATKEPCNKCSEIQYSNFKFKNHFVPVRKN